MVTPTRGALAMLAGLSGVVHQRGHWRRVGFYVSGGSIAPCGLLLYLAWTGTSRAAFDAVIVFTATRYAGFQYVPFGSWADAQNIPLIAVFPAAFGLSLLIAAMRRFGGQSRRDIAFACAGFIGCFPRPDIFHIAFAVPLALPLLAGCVTRLSGPLRGSTRLAAAAITLLIMAPSLITYGGIVMESRGGITIQTALGEVTWFGPPEAAEMLRRIADLPANDRLLFYPLMALAPFLTGREDVSALDTYAPGYTLAAQYRDTCLAAVHRADYVVIDRRWTDPAALKNVFPAMRDPRPPATIAFEQALDRGFVLTAAEGMLELRRRQPDIDVTICSGIAE